MAASPPNTPLHVARNGQVIGQYRADQISDLLESGGVLLEDHIYDPGKSEWVEVKGWLKTQVPLEKEEDEEASTDDETESGEASASERPARASRRSRGSSSASSRRGKSRKRNPAESALPGWVACLFAVGAAAGIWAWAQSLREELRISEERAQSLSETVTTLQRQNELLLEMSPPGHVRGILTQEPMPGKIAIISGATIGLIKRSDVEEALKKVADTPPPVTDEEFAALVAAVQSSLPSPIQISLTDSSGRFDLPVEDKGDYVIVSNAVKQSSSGPERLFWLVSFESTDDPSPVMLLNERNAISLRKPEFNVSQPRSLAN
jgi:hypothetical protein